MKKNIPHIVNLLFILCCLTTYGQKLPYQNTSLSYEQRANDLVSRMTIEEKVSQMMSEAPAIKRLNIDAYNWWNECLHGVARAGIATVFPQAIGLSATFDNDAMLKTAQMISDEARAKHHEALRNGQFGIYQGLNFWSPNINIFRDPRWGRGQETYGEDPYLTSIMGEYFVRGLQGDNPKYLKLAATAKHYAIHSGPEYERHSFDTDVTPYDLWDTYLPAFHHLVEKAKVESVMCAYNRFQGEACCGNSKLETEILKKQWGFKGYIVSDCGAIDDIYQHHKIVPDAEQASILAVRSGTDLECGDRYATLLDAVKNKKIDEKEIDKSVKQLFLSRMKLGMFDPQENVPYSKIPYSVVDSKEHQKQALEMAQKSIVLLKNENNTLPLSKNIKTIAIVGPNADNAISVLGNYNGTPSHTITPLQGIKNKLGDKVKVIYEKAINFTNDTLASPIDIKNNLSSNGIRGLKAEYFDNIKLEGTPILVRNEETIDFKGDVSTEIAPGILAKWISIRWTGIFTATKTQAMSFSVTGDDGFRLFINGKKVIDHFNYHEALTDYCTFQAEAGKSYDIKLEYFQGDQGARINFRGVLLQKTNMQALTEELKDADAIVFVGGISPEIEGEEMPVVLDGFKKGDRTTIALPKIQTELLQYLKQTGKPLVFVMETGSALGIKWEKENIPAIVNSWYGGQDAGTALADVLFGDYNPAGRLPVTFYESDSDLPDYKDYSMKNRTYRYFKGKPLYAFGYGLSYTSFKYSNLISPKTATTGNDLSISVSVKNTGKYDGEEVVQVYVSHSNIAYEAPIRSLVAFKRIFLKAGEEKKVDLKINARSLSLITPELNRSIEPGTVQVSVGGHQPDDKKSTLSSLVDLKGKKINLTK